MAYFLKNPGGEYVKKIDTANEKLELTKKQDEAFDYSGRPGGGRWDAENEKHFIVHYFEKEFGERVTELQAVYEEVE